MANRKNLRSTLGRGVGSAISDTSVAYFHDNGDGTFDEAAAAHQYIYVAGQWIKWDGSISVTVGAIDIGAVEQVTGQGKTLLFGAISQGAAGSTQLVAANGTKKVKVVSYAVVLDAAGTFKFTDGTADLSGAYPVSTNGGLVDNGQPSSHIMETAAINRPLNIVTVTGKAFGRFSYFLEA